MSPSILWPHFDPPKRRINLQPQPAVCGALLQLLSSCPTRPGDPSMIPQAGHKCYKLATTKVETKLVFGQRAFRSRFSSWCTKVVHRWCVLFLPSSIPSLSCNSSNRSSQPSGGVPKPQRASLKASGQHKMELAPLDSHPRGCNGDHSRRKVITIDMARLVHHGHVGQTLCQSL